MININFRLNAIVSIGCFLVAGIDPLFKLLNAINDENKSLIALYSLILVFFVFTACFGLYLIRLGYKSHMRNLKDRLKESIL